MVQEQTTDTVLEVQNLDVEYRTESGPVKALRDVTLEIGKGDILGIAGESGSGKSTLAHAILRYLGENGRITNGDVLYNGLNLKDLSRTQVNRLRGNEIAHVPQDPGSSLNPSLRVGEQIKETLLTHTDLSSTKATAKVHELLREVNIPDPEYNAKKYPHQLSGGMQQRVLIAMALSCDPDLLILDEPTTGLDVTVQTKIMDLVNDLSEVRSTTIVLITHDISIIAETCNKIAIMYAGEVMEKGSIEEVLLDSANPYTQGLLAALPRLAQTQGISPIPGSAPDLTNFEAESECVFADRCEFAEAECRQSEIAEEVVSTSGHLSRCRRWEHVQENPIEPERDPSASNDGCPSRSRRFDEPENPLVAAENVRKLFVDSGLLSRFFGSGNPVKAVNGVSLDVSSDETLGLVGESGCGKSTLGECLLRLLEVDDGVIRYHGQDISEMSKSDLREFRSDCQIVFQNPHSSLNPKKTVRSTLDRTIKLHSDYGRRERAERILDLLQQVSLSKEHLDRYPHELSGGEKQRVAIARAFSVSPAFVVLDEPVSALDVSVQASIIELLDYLQRDYQSSFLFISHDISVVKLVSDRIAVMYLGNIVEIGSNEEVFSPPYHPYTRTLLSNVPSPDPSQNRDRIKLEGDVPSARNPPSGCPFHTRCPQKIGDICETETPTLEQISTEAGSTHRIACHLDIDDMSEPID